MSKVNGKKWRVYLVDSDTSKVLPFETTSSFEITNALIDDSDKDSDNYESAIDGKRSWNTSATMNYDQENAEVQKIIDKLILPDGDTITEVLIGLNNDTGDIAYKSFARIEKVGISAGDGDLITVDVDFKGVKLLTKVTKD